MKRAKGETGKREDGDRVILFLSLFPLPILPSSRF